MKFEIVELAEFSGKAAKFYSIIIIDEETNPDNWPLFDHFVERFQDSYPEEIQDIFDALETMGNSTGLSSNRIIPFEGENYEDGIVAICNRPNKLFRLYAIMYGELLAIIGDGELKSGGGPIKNYPALKATNDIIKEVKKILDAAELSGDLEITSTGLFSKTNFFYHS